MQIHSAFNGKEREKEREIFSCCNFTQLQCQILLMGMHDVQIMQTFPQRYVHFLSYENGDYYGKCIISLKSGLWNIHIYHKILCILDKVFSIIISHKWFCIVFICAQNLEQTLMHSDDTFDEKQLHFPMHFEMKNGCYHSNSMPFHDNKATSGPFSIYQQQQQQQQSEWLTLYNLSTVIMLTLVAFEPYKMSHSK